MDSTAIALLYIGETPLPEAFSEDPALKVHRVLSPDMAGAVDTRPDIILMAPDLEDPAAVKKTAGEWIKRAGVERFRFIPGLFCTVGPGCSRDMRLDILEAGFDQVVEQPLSSREILLAARVHAEKIHLAQQQHADSQALEKSFSYLDRFKAELKAVKAELMEEKTSLNTALKQIQEMTGERRRLKQGVAELKEAQHLNMEGFGRILTTLIRARVEKNRGHGEQVAGIAEFLGREMGLDENRLEDLGKAAMLHEAGLLFMSEGFLADKEQKENTSGMKAFDRTMMIQYPVKGADLLSKCPGFEHAARIIRSLNEWSDGTGYPDGLKRRHIPVESRILAGADELENLREQPDIKGPEALLAGLEEMAGARLDPVIVGLLGKYVVTRIPLDSFRVRGVGIDQLEPGMRLGAALFTATGTKLFSANTELNQESIEKIIQYSREYPVDEIVYVKV